MSQDDFDPSSVQEPHGKKQKLDKVAVMCLAERRDGKRAMRELFVDRTSYVMNLRDSIEAGFDDLLHVDGRDFAAFIQLWRVDVKCNRDEFTLNEMEATKLRSLERLNMIWPDQPPRNMINVYALVTGGTNKRHQSPRLEETRLVVEESSSMTMEAVRTLQSNDPAERVINNRPEYDTDWAPVELLYPGFLVFQEVAIRHKIPPYFASYVNEYRLELSMMTIRGAISEYHNDETARSEALLAELGDLFTDCSTGNRFSYFIPGRANKHRVIDGYLRGSHGTQYFMAKLELDVSSTGAVPTNQCAAEFAKSAVSGHKSHPDLFRSWRVPAAAMIVHGTQIQLFGMVLCGVRVRMMPLSSPVDLAWNPTESPESRENILWFLRAAIILEEKIHRDIVNALYQTTFNKIPDHTWPFPAFTHADRYEDGEFVAGETIRFSLQQHMVDEAGRLLYTATAPSGEATKDREVMVKFCRRYSVELHIFLAKKGRAPQLLGFQRLDGGWCVVVMERLTDYLPMTKKRAAMVPNLKDDLWNLMEEMHSEELVHGDMREDNIFLQSQAMDNRPSFALIDFDWGGKIGEAKFPSRLLNEHIHVSDMKTLLIAKEDDRKTLEGAFRRMFDVL